MEKEVKADFKLIKTTTGAIRVSQACDRCRIKKIKCDGLTPCHNCSKIAFECKTSDKLTRRAFPKGYTENLERKVKELEDENMRLKDKYEPGTVKAEDDSHMATGAVQSHTAIGNTTHNTTGTVTLLTATSNDPHQAQTHVQINNPIDQIFNLDGKGIIIGNDNLNFESQFNHLLINLNLPFLKITNSHNFLLNDPNLYLYHPSYTKYNRFHNRDLDVIYNPITANNSQHDDYLGEMVSLANNELPIDIYDLFIKLINNFKKLFNSKRELDSQVIQFFLNYNVFIPVFDFKLFIESYDAFHTMYPFMFTYDDATINGFNILNNDYHVVNEYLMVVVQIYAMVMMNDPTINLNLLLNHSEPNYVKNSDPYGNRSGSATGIGSAGSSKKKSTSSVIRSLYDFLPYFNVFHVSVGQLQTYLLFLYYSIITNNKEKSLVLSSLINSFIGILGINLNSKNLFFNDLTLTTHQRRTRVKIFWCFKILLKVFNLKFGFKPSLNTTVINPVTIDRYFELTPAKLQSLLEEPSTGNTGDDLFRVLLKPSVEFLNLVNIIIPSSFSPNYYQYLKGEDGHQHQQPSKKRSSRLDWILNDDDGDGNDGNLNYNFTQFLTIDRNLVNWRASLKEKELDLIPLQMHMNLPVLSSVSKNNLYHSIPYSTDEDDEDDGRDSIDMEVTDNSFYKGLPPVLTNHAKLSFLNTGLPDTYTASELIKVQLNFHFLLIRSMNYLNFVIDKELTSSYYRKIREISREVLAYFLTIFQHVGESSKIWQDPIEQTKAKNPHNAVMESLGLDVDEDGFVINDFSVKRRRVSHSNTGGSGGYLGSGPGPKENTEKRLYYELPKSPFNYILNGLSMTVINLKKSIILQMLYLLICSLKMFKKGDGKVPRDIKYILNASVNLFIKVFINYNPDVKKLRPKTFKNGMSVAGEPAMTVKELKLFGKLINDELKDEILREPRRSGTDESDDEDASGEEEGEDSEGNEISMIDWDDEDMDEDLKYLKVLKFIKYKINSIYTIAKSRNNKEKKPNDVKLGKSQKIKKENPTHVQNPNHQHSSMGQNTQTQSVPMKLHSTEVSPRFPTGSGTLSKMPSLTKFDFLMGGEESYPSHSLGNTQNPNQNQIHNHQNLSTNLNEHIANAHHTAHLDNIAFPMKSKLKEFEGSTTQREEELELLKKERLAINDLMSLKHKGAGSPLFQTHWNYKDERK